MSRKTFVRRKHFSEHVKGGKESATLSSEKRRHSPEALKLERAPYVLGTDGDGQGQVL